MAKIAFSENQEFGSWSLKSRHSGGGNSSVWIAKHRETNEEKIIKLLRKAHDTAKLRFQDEVKIMTENQDNPGVMRILDSSVDGEFLWYIMPRSETLNNYLAGKHSTVVINSIIQIAKTLSKLHAKGVSHRDIKPQNLFFKDGDFIIGDFGLVDYPDKENDLTLQGTSLGPRCTIAPEMRNNPESANGIPADVYSLSKTLWILLTSIERGFEGQYSPTGSIGLSNYIPDIYLNVLEDLLVKSTENNPDIRPTIDEFIDELEEWVELQDNFLKRNDLDWKIVQYKLFPLNMPSYAEWTDIDEICSILNIIGGIPSLNHLFFHNGGGHDLKGAKRSIMEPGLLELDFGIPYIVKPKRLIFCSFNNDLEWNYFYLELDKIEPIYEASKRGSEQVVEIDGTEYKKDDYIEYFYEQYDDGYRDFPKVYRTVIRLMDGNLVVFKKISSYNLTSSTYDGRHNMGADEFRKYIQKLVDMGYRAYYIEEEGQVVGVRSTHRI